MTRALPRSFCGPRAQQDELAHRSYVGPRHAWRTRMVRRALLRFMPPGKLLDAGCGDADLAQAMTRDGYDVVAIDRDATRLAMARRRSDRRITEGSVLWVCADVTQLPFGAGTFSGVVMGEVLEHVRDDARAVTEARRMLVPRGWFVATVPTGSSRFDALDRAVGHVRRYDRGGLRRLITRGGLELRLQRGWGFPFGRMYDALVMRPAHRVRASGAGRVVWRMGQTRWLHAVWSALFGLDDLVDSGGEGSGWLVVAQRREEVSSRGVVAQRRE